MKPVAILFFVAMIMMTSSSANFMRRGLWDSFAWKKKSVCTEVSGQCFSTEHCCEGLVCASFDDYFGEQPEAPGSCVKEKDLKPCQRDDDCELGSRCLPMGRSKEFYCLPRPGYVEVQAPHRGSGRLPTAPGNTNGGSLGAPCQTSTDCRSFTTDGRDELCCKDVHRGRYGSKRMCDRTGTVGPCIGRR